MTRPDAPAYRDASLPVDASGRRPARPHDARREGRAARLRLDHRAGAAANASTPTPRRAAAQRHRPRHPHRRVDRPAPRRRAPAHERDPALRRRADAARHPGRRPRGVDRRLLRAATPPCSRRRSASPRPGTRRCVEDVAGVIRDQLLAVGARHTLAPVLDVARDPRWGRVEETYGEDPVPRRHARRRLRARPADRRPAPTAWSPPASTSSATGCPRAGMNHAPVHARARASCARCTPSRSPPPSATPAWRRS